MEKLMYCTNCDCEYDGWSAKCPSCKQQLLDEKPETFTPVNGHLDYDELVAWIVKQGNVTEFELAANQVIRKKSTRFPYMGFGYAWTQAMRGDKDNTHVELVTSEVGKDRETTFPYKGHGYGWQQEMQGSIAGNQLTLKATSVNRKKTWRFPYFGYGYAWTEQLQGTCGDRIKVTLKASKVTRRSNWRFPYFGYGYAWVDKYQIKLEVMS